MDETTTNTHEYAKAGDVLYAGTTGHDVVLADAEQGLVTLAPEASKEMVRGQLFSAVSALQSNLSPLAHASVELNTKQASAHSHGLRVWERVVPVAATIDPDHPYVFDIKRGHIPNAWVIGDERNNWPAILDWVRNVWRLPN